MSAYSTKTVTRKEAEELVLAVRNKSEHKDI